MRPISRAVAMMRGRGFLAGASKNEFISPKIGARSEVHSGDLK